LHFSDAIICLIYISTGWWECTQIGERLNKKVIESCRDRVNFGGYIFDYFGNLVLHNGFD